MSLVDKKTRQEVRFDQRGVWRNPELTLQDKAVYIELASYAPLIFPSIRKMARNLPASKTTILKSLRTLREKGLIKRFKLGKKIYYKLKYLDNPVPPRAVEIQYKERWATDEETERGLAVMREAIANMKVMGA